MSENKYGPGWHDTRDKKPPKNTPVLGYDLFYEEVHLCTWNGKSTDDMGDVWMPPEHTDDCYIRLWHEQIPYPENTDEVPE